MTYLSHAKTVHGLEESIAHCCPNAPLCLNKAQEPRIEGDFCGWKLADALVLAQRRLEGGVLGAYVR
jgi:hypothetical protein